MKKKLLLLLTFFSFLLAGCGRTDSPNTLTVLNYGKYIEPKVLELFEEETGIKVDRKSVV